MCGLNIEIYAPTFLLPMSKPTNISSKTSQREWLLARAAVHENPVVLLAICTYQVDEDGPILSSWFEYAHSFVRISICPSPHSPPPPPSPARQEEWRCYVTSLVDTTTTKTSVPRCVSIRRVRSSSLPGHASTSVVSPMLLCPS